jgi:putative acetyltransferase
MTSVGYTVRAERLGDEEAIRAVHEAAFPSDLEARLVDALRSAGRLSESLVAVADGQIIGHVAFSPITCEGAAAGLGLAPLAVLEDFRRRGVGASLVRHGLAAARRSGCKLVVLLGSPTYYGRFGFRSASQWGLTCEFDGGDAFQAIELVQGAAGKTGGQLRYAPEFSSFAKS